MSALDSLNNNNTIIENVEYLDMLDPKNSWYFDAERFDVNFPLVCSYRGDVDERTGFLYTLFNYWAHVFSYYGTKPGMTAFCLSKLGSSPPNRDLKEDIFCQEGYREVLWDIADNFSKPEFLFYFKDLYSDGTVYYRFLIGCYTDSGTAEAKGQFLKTFPLSDFTSPFYAYAPRSQLIVTRDWGLVHRYFSWVFRNHQYENSKFIYFLEGSPNLIPESEEFKDIDSIRDSRLSDFPANYRNNPLEYLNSDNAYELSPYKIFDYSFIATRTK